MGFNSGLKGLNWEGRSGKINCLWMSWFQTEVFSDPLQAVTLLVIFMSQRDFHITHSSCIQKAKSKQKTQGTKYKERQNNTPQFNKQIRL
jgi:phosphatidylserine decarboxylase